VAPAAGFTPELGIAPLTGLDAANGAGPPACFATGPGIAPVAGFAAAFAGAGVTAARGRAAGVAAAPVAAPAVAAAVAGAGLAAISLARSAASASRSGERPAHSRKRLTSRACEAYSAASTPIPKTATKPARAPI